MPLNLRKFARDLGLLLAATGLTYVGDHVADLGLPDDVAVLVGAAALLGYRVVRAKREGRGSAWE